MSDRSGRWRPRPVGVAIMVLIALLGLGIAASLSLDAGDTDPIEIEGAQSVQRLLGGIQQEGALLGDDEAPVTVQVLNDMQCERCADWQLEVIPPLVEGPVRGGEVNLEYRHYALGDRASGLAFFGAVSAGLQGRQWQYLQLFFINQDEASERGVTDEVLEGVASAVLEFNVEQWQRDFDEPEVEEAIAADAEYTASLELPADPAVIVRGARGERTLTGAPSLDEIRRAIAEVS